MKGQARHRFVFRLLQIALGPLIRRKFNYSSIRAKLVNKPAIILPNHVTFWDPLLVGISFATPMYFVSSDHIFRLGITSKIIQFLVDPIPRTKSDTDRKTVISMFKRLRAGKNICIFPEGKMTWTGETDRLHATTARLIKRSGAALVTFRMIGGYLSQPRWSRYIRRGKMTGSVVREYSPAELAKLSLDQIEEIIKEDLYENAYERQRKEPQAYRGKKLAENLELALYICPACNSICSLKSQDDLFYCSCGYKVIYNEYGYFTGSDTEKPIFETVLDWSKWQNERVVDLAKDFKNMPLDHVIFEDKTETLWRIERARRSELLGKGTLQLYKDRLVFKSPDKDYTFPLDKISNLDIHGRSTIIFTTATDENYELKSKHARCALKYQDFYRQLKTKKKGEN